MLRVFDFRIPGTNPPVTIKLASLGFGQAEEFVKRCHELLHGEVSPSNDDWNLFEHNTILDSMVGAGSETTMDDLRTNFDIPTMHAMYDFIRDKSGLKLAAPEGEGKAAATPISASSAAA